MKMRPTTFITFILAISFLLCACGNDNDDSDSASDMGLPIQQLDFDTMEISPDLDTPEFDLDLD